MARRLSIPQEEKGKNFLSPKIDPLLDFWRAVCYNFSVLYYD